ncbi:MAG: gas vesicle protein [Acidobacteria bacterium]|nr:gas vesicle protein [Acidobacteriota bacterium]MBI3280455.1 gas vesicle protein [Acidobacteriota bacterium]
MQQPHAVTHSMQTSSLADVLERVLDKGIVIAGDIRVKLVDIELLSIQLRLVICSVDKAREMGMDWWVNQPVFAGRPAPDAVESSLARIEERLARLETAVSQ